MNTLTLATKSNSAQREILARQGMRMPAITLKRLRAAGIYCQPTVSIEHQLHGKRWVLRGVESGGATAELGAYSSFVDGDGHSLSWLQRVDSIAVNGVHAVVVAPVFVRVEMLRIERTYDLLVTRHSLTDFESSRRPKLESVILFYGRRGSLEMELWGKDAQFQGVVCPVFYSRGGDRLVMPAEFQQTAARATAAVCCVGCRHSHLLQASVEPVQELV